MKRLQRKFRTVARSLAAFVSSAVVFALLQANVLGVSATLLPILVSVNHLDFGSVFPGEALNRQFTVTMAPANQSQTVQYWIEQKRKPLPPQHPEYPSGGDPGLPGHYRDLCPYLTKTAELNEGDNEASATLTAPGDTVDNWRVALDVPAIADAKSGGVSQDHRGGIITTNGEYGCDISINVEPKCGNGIEEPGEACDLGVQNGLPGSHCSAQCTTVQDCTTPVDVVLVFDRSGSMAADNGQRLIDAKVAAKGFVDLLGVNDHASLVSYASFVTTNHTLNGNFALIKTKIDALVAVGATNIGDAIKAANTELMSVRARGSATHVEILLTDGRANKPNGNGKDENALDVAYAVSRAQEAAAKGFKIFTIGLGSDINAAMLQQIATLTGGQYFASPTSGDLAAIYAQISQALCPAVPRCGDKVVNQPSEACDDGNNINDDACRNDCKLPASGGPGTFCGDGNRQTPNDSGFNEQCDDGNQVALDGCETDCTTTTFCGDEQIQAPNDSFQIEGCDLGASNGVACVAGYGQQCTYCSASCQPVVVTGPRCGDGTANGPEQCDDGNTVDNDTCRNDCTLVVPPFCGDHVINQPSEECDDGPANGQPGSLCNALCRRMACTQPTDVVLVFDRSGSMALENGQRLIDAKNAAKGFVDQLEVVDRVGLVSYASFVQTNQTLSSNFVGLKAKIDALVAVGSTNIGDAIKAANTELMSVRARGSATHVEILLTDGRANKPNGNGKDENALDVAYAVSRAQEAAAKGFKIFTIGLGSDINAAMLQQIATLTGGQYFASPNSSDLAAIYEQIAGDLCPDARCGDHVINQQSEQCDNGPTNGNACTPDYGKTCSYCSATCHDVQVLGPRCGDSITNGPELCDDGNSVDYDACRNDCTPNLIGLGPPICGGSPDNCTNASGHQGPLSFCGDGAVNQPSEQCDGPDNGVACQAGYGETCQYCTASCQQATVVGPRCGDAIKNGREACDDGNVVETDSCRNDCTLEAAAAPQSTPTPTPTPTPPATPTPTPEPPPTVTTASGGGGSGGGLYNHYPRLSLTKSVSPVLVAVGGTVRYTLEIVNRGGLAGNELTVEDRLPPGFVFVDTGSGVKTWQLGTIGSFGGTIVLDYDVLVNATVAAGQYYNHATSSVTNGQPPYSIAAASATVEVAAGQVLGTDDFSDAGGVGGDPGDGDTAGVGRAGDARPDGRAASGSGQPNGSKILGKKPASFGSGSGNAWPQGTVLGDATTTGNALPADLVSVSDGSQPTTTSAIIELSGTSACQVWLWLFVAVHILLAAIIVVRRGAGGAWALGAVVTFAPVVARYPSCLLVWWLFVTAAAHVVYVLRAWK